MAQRRMFSLKVIDTDLFLEMPQSSRLLYYELCMRADDDGFVASPNKIRKMVGCSEDDFKILMAKQYIIPFESGVCVIKHWRIHNLIRSDRYNATEYKQEKSMLIDDNGKYEIGIQNVIPNGDKRDTQDRLGKDRLELGKVRLLDTTKVVSSNKLQPIIDNWKSLNLSKIIKIQGNRLKMLNTRIKEHGIDEILKAIENIKTSSFLKGQNNRNWTITFDWFIKPDNFIKVLEGNYSNKEESHVISKKNNIKKPVHNFTGRQYTDEEFLQMENENIENKIVSSNKDAQALLEEYKNRKKNRDLE